MLKISFVYEKTDTQRAEGQMQTESLAKYRLESRYLFTHIQLMTYPRMLYL